MSTRKIPLKTAYNVRSLGGYPIGQGDTTTAVFLRGDCLCTMDACDVKTLLDMGVRTVVDLRGDLELEQIPDAFAKREDGQYVHIPLMSDPGGQPALPDMQGFSMDRLYINLLDHAGERLLLVFRALAEGARRGKVLFHCAAGKDRTGLVAALLLDLAGVEMPWIVHDYALTGKYLEPVKDLLIRAGGMDAYPPDLRDALLSADAENMEATLFYLHKKYTDARTYLLHIGLNEAEADLLEAMLRKGYIN